MGNQLDMNDEQGWEYVQEQLDVALGEQCVECGGQIATDTTPKWVFRERDICECKEVQ